MATHKAPSEPRKTIAALASAASLLSTKTQLGAQAFPGNFTGNVSVTPFLNPTDTLAASGALVSFDAGARSAWHSHPAGQTLFVTSGTGWVQESGGKKIEIKQGEVVWTPPGVKHWHGATANSAMTHVAIQGFGGGKNVEWVEPVTNEQYGK